MTADAAEPEYVAETWFYMGRRVDRKGKLCYLWRDMDGEDHSYSKLKGLSPGSAYTVETRREDGSIYARPDCRYNANVPAHEQAAAWQAADRAAYDSLTRDKLERGAKSRELDAALEPLLAIARSMTGAQRSAFVGLVVERLSRGW